MNQSIQKITGYICLFVGVIFLINTPVVLAQKKSPYYVKPFIWKGIITIKKVGSADYTKEKNTKSMKSVSIVKTSLIDKVEIKFCGEVEKFFLEDVIRTYVYNHKKNFVKEYSSTQCPRPPKSKEGNYLKTHTPDIRKPGNSREIDESIIKTIYSSKDWRSPKEMTNVILKILPDGRYTLLVKSDVYATTKQFTTDEEKRVCKNDGKKHTVDIRTCDFDEKEETIIGEELMSSKIHPRLVTLPFMSPKNSYIENNSIKGTMKISETKPKFEGDYKEICTASWELNAKDPCPIVYRNMMYDVAMAEAFSDIEIMDLAESMEEYLDLVDQKADEIFKGGTGISLGGDGDSEVRMSTNSNCKIIFRDEDGNEISKNEYKNRIAKKCLPYILFEQSLAHEEKHVDQCKKYHDEFIRGGKTDPEIRGMMEVCAYLRGIKKLFYWLKENCEEHDLTDVKVRIKNIEALPIKQYK